MTTDKTVTLDTARRTLKNKHKLKVSIEELRAFIQDPDATRITQTEIDRYVAEHATANDDGNGASASVSTPITSVVPASQPVAAPEAKEPHLSYVAYRAWEDTVAFPHPDFRELATWPAKESRPGSRGTEQDTMVKYRTPDGGERVMRLSQIEDRQARQGDRGLGYFLLSRNLEKEGVELVADFPGAPTLESKCAVTGLPLFSSEAELYAYFRDVLEAILTAKVEPENVTWQERHWQAWKFENDWLRKYQAVARQVKAGLAQRGADDAERQKVLRAMDEEWQSKGRKLLGWFRHKRTHKDLLDWLEGKMDKTLTNIQKEVT